VRDPILNLLPTYDTRLAERRREWRLPNTTAESEQQSINGRQSLEARSRSSLIETCLFDRHQTAEANAAHKAVCDAVRDSINTVVAEHVAGMAAEDRAARAVVAAVNDAARRGRKTVKIADLVEVFTAAQNEQADPGGAPDA
jgi:hypothetical protein